MLFVEFYGPADTFAATCGAIQERIAAVFRTPAADVIVRRIVAESAYPGVEVWIELSSDEQLYRYGRRLAADVSEAIRATQAVDVWVLFRIVPLAYAFLNGTPRRRDAGPLEK
ncbi:MAG TPA: hypothetical protein VFE37_01410 [Chloroflexota bacterium]|nr:hypothetical protein [Chloroflexota bacterium]